MRGRAAAELNRDILMKAFRLDVWEEPSETTATEPEHRFMLGDSEVRFLMESILRAAPDLQPDAISNEEVKYLRSLLDRILPSALRDEARGGAG